jgi:copper transport protein
MAGAVRLRGRRRALPALLLVLVWLAFSSLARPAAISAHAVLLRSSPVQNARLAAPPARLQLFFSEPLDRSLSSVEVRNAGGVASAGRHASFTADPTEMDLALPELAPGFYAVAWTTVSAVDGHRLLGEYPFTVLQPDGSTPTGVVPTIRTAGGGVQPIDAAVRFVLLVGLIALIGAFVFGLVVFVPALRQADEAAAAAHAWPLLARWIAPAAALVALASLAGLLRQIGASGGADQLGGVLGSRTGEAALARLALALLLAGVARGLRGGRAGWYVWLGLAASLATLATLSLTSHAAARTGAGWGVPIDFAHLLAVAVWLGGLLYLPLLLRGTDSQTRLRAAGLALTRFSALAVVAIVAIVLSGLFSASIETGSLRNIADTGYGQTLLIKVAAVALTFVFGAINALLLGPRLARAAAEGSANEAAAAARSVLRALLCEIGGGLVVVGLTAVMVWMVPARDAAAQRRAASAPGATDSVYRNSAPASDLQAALVVSPNRPGLNTFRVALTGPAVNAVTRVELRFQPPDHTQGSSTLDLDPAGSGVFSGQAANLLAAGDWEVTVNIRRSGLDDANGRFTVQVPDATGATVQSPTAGSGTWTYPLRGISENQTLAVVLAFVGFVLYRSRRRLAESGLVAGRAATGLTALSLVAAGTLFFATHSHGGAGDAPPLENPVAADQASVADGATLYAQNCARCHGVAGHGDGPQAASLHPRPYDLTVHVGLHPDYQLFDYISNGIPSTAMPAWQSQLTDKQRWDLINYLRTLSPEG